jgi:hypothetical protein
MNVLTANSVVMPPTCIAIVAPMFTAVPMPFVSSMTSVLPPGVLELAMLLPVAVAVSIPSTVRLCAIRHFVDRLLVGIDDLWCPVNRLRVVCRHSRHRGISNRGRRRVVHGHRLRDVVAAIRHHDTRNGHVDADGPVSTRVRGGSTQKRNTGGENY